MEVRASATAAAVFLGGLLATPPPTLAQDASPVTADAAPPSTPPSRLSITSDSECPSGQAVRAELEAIGPPDQEASGTVSVRVVDNRLLVDLVSGTATRRELAATGDCATRATTVALVIATWTGELAVAGEPTLRPPNDPPAPEPARVSPVVAPPSAREHELGAGPVLTLSDGLAPGVEVDYLQTRAPRGLGWQAGLLLPARRDRSDHGLVTRWTRPAVSVALNGRITLRSVALSAGAGLVAAYTLISARGYSFQHDARALTLGTMVEARAALPWGRLRVWTALRGGRWLIPQAVMIETQDGDRVATIDLPSWDLQWAVGLGYLLR